MPPLNENKIREIIKEELRNFDTIERYTFQKNIQIFEGRNIQLATKTGTQFGTATNQLLAFHGNTPVIQGSTISDPSGGATQDDEARTAIDALIDRLQDIGIIA